MEILRGIICKTGTDWCIINQDPACLGPHWYIIIVTATLWAHCFGASPKKRPSGHVSPSQKGLWRWFHYLHDGTDRTRVVPKSCSLQICQWRCPTPTGILQIHTSTIINFIILYKPFFFTNAGFNFTPSVQDHGAHARASQPVQGASKRTSKTARPVWAQQTGLTIRVHHHFHDFRSAPWRPLGSLGTFVADSKGQHPGMKMASSCFVGDKEPDPVEVASSTASCHPSWS